MLLAAALAWGPLAAKTYRWVDDDGTVVYSQTPPRDNRPTTDVAPPPPPPPVSPEQAQQELEQRIQKLDDLREDKELAADKSAKSRRDRAEKRRACEAARHNYDNLQRSMKKRIRMPDGSYQRLDENERQKRLSEAEARIAENCK